MIYNCKIYDISRIFFTADFRKAYNGYFLNMSFDWLTRNIFLVLVCNYIDI
jgi:hypothetical protein